MAFNYIVFRIDDEHLIRELPIIYPDILVHADVAAAFKTVKGMEKAVPVAAGSLDVGCTGVGEGSSTLKLKSRQDDIRLINNFPYFHGIK